MSGIFGSLGILVQLALLFGVAASLRSSRGTALAALYGALVAIVGYPLVVVALLFVNVPWQVTNVILAATIVGAFALRSVREPVLNGLRMIPSDARRNWPALAIIVAALGIHWTIAAFKPEVSGDGMMYHGPILALLSQSGSLWGWDMVSQYMAYTDLTMVGAINLATFTGTAAFDDAAQIPHLFVLLLVLNVAFQRRFRSSTVRMCLAILIVSAPVIWLQPRTLLVDLAYGAAISTSIVLIAVVRHARPLDTMMCAMAIAGVLASKPTGIATSALLLGFLVLAVIVRGVRQRARVGPLLLHHASAALVPLLLSLTFYARNLIAFGNPVYPVRVSLGPLDLRGVVDFSLFSSGDRGAGLVDLIRLRTFAEGLASGAMHGVTKLDYDPREGGFGYVPLWILILAVALLIAQAIVGVLRTSRFAWRADLFVPAIIITALSIGVITLQPASFDSRYVIGPTVCILAATLAISPVLRPPRLIDAIAALCALILAGNQIWWTETHMNPGLRSVLDTRSYSADLQADTPGNPWGQGWRTSWLGDDCSTIALQTSGGLDANGWQTDAPFAALPYPLYGPRLCNEVIGITIPGVVADGARQGAAEAALMTADYLVLYERDMAFWEAAYPASAQCWQRILTIPAFEGSFPEANAVLANTCALRN
ncbi:hypothetical protein [Microbacterium sp. BR1]|uniref:hypothetical protein n=1 Tax=Microbacterium sp. BR1 TaxID=1070896 RepID=UPI000C2B6943|nr:hypothetical protein [Microbacterium sp. BR1]